MENIYAILKGALFNLSIIISIGPQNLFLIRKALRQEHPLILASLASIFDVILIVLGIYGLNAVLDSNPTLKAVVKYGGATFLSWYGIQSLRRAFNPQPIDINLKEQSAKKSSAKRAILTLMGVTFLNPNVLIDTIVVIGSTGAVVDEKVRHFFTIGTAIGGAIWYFSLCYGLRLLAPMMQSKKFWRCFEVAVAMIMFSVVYRLLNL
jgi:L-lysine exporter family protein LysE/ArgO